MKITQFFCLLGYQIANNKINSLVLCFVITVIMGIGILNIKIVSNPQDLWVNKSLRTNKEQTEFNNRYGSFFRINQIIVK
jgi:Niemann-Pick C1 protein